MIEINIENDIYPKKLLKISNPPQKLYAQGNIKILEEQSISVIGSREHSDYGRRMCEKFTRELVENSINIVSGMAKGIDSLAHKTCIKNKGKTIAVLPSGFDNIYPSENKQLFYEIIKTGGIVLSEYPPEAKYDIKKPIERNRIVSGLSMATLVIEAGYRSGTSVTAKLAMEQNKNVFCIPSSLENRNGCTSNEIIKKGGKLITCIEDILNKYPEIIRTQKSLKMNHSEEQYTIKQEYLDTYNILSYEPMHINEIYKKVKLSISEINYKLMMLEIEGNIIQMPGKLFKRK